MTDARRVDLNYGHFGEPVYDIDTHEWHFPRKVQSAPQLQQLGESRLLLPPQLSAGPDNASSGASQRKKEIKRLVRNCPELAPSAGFLPALAEESEAVQDETWKYDAALSDLMDFGCAYHPLHHRKNARTVPVLAVPAGAAGEFVRIVQLVPQFVGWDNEAHTILQDEILQTRVQGLWYGNGNRIQQLHFAESNGEPTEWLAVRYGGSTSILRVILRETEVPLSHMASGIPAIEPDVELRFELRHIVTLSMRRSGGSPQADVSFNPWNSREFAIIDQDSRLTIWRIESVNKNLDLWTVESWTSGQLADDQPDDDEASSLSKLDGWGLSKWISKGACLLVCNRKRVACFALQDPPVELPMPDLGLRKTKTWILDVRESSKDSDHLFVATTARIFLLCARSEHADGKQQPQLRMEILLSLTHFRNELDTSLSLQVVNLGPMTKVLLYSRLTDLETVFTFNALPSTSRPQSSVCDPYIIRDRKSAEPWSSRRLSVAFRVLLLERPQHKDEVRQNSWYTKRMTLGADLSVREYFVVATSTQLDHPLVAPTSQGRPQALRKSSFRVEDDFIVPDGMLEAGSRTMGSGHAGHPNIAEEEVTSGSSDSHETRDTGTRRDPEYPEDHWTINMEWLTTQIRHTVTASLDEALELVSGQISDRIGSASPGIMPLSEVVDQEVAGGDVDEDSTALENKLRDLENSSLASHHGYPNLRKEPSSISRLTTTSTPSIISVGPHDSLSQTYDALISSWMVSLPLQIPRRVRIRYERIVRSIAIELQLASYGLKPQRGEHQLENGLQRTPNDGQAGSSRPVRRTPAFSQDSRRVKARAIEQASSKTTSSQLADDEESATVGGLLTPEPTPSLPSHGSRGTQSIETSSEDPAIHRLRALADLAPQPPLPAGLAGTLTHWQLGQNPDDYDWEKSTELVERAGGGDDDDKLDDIEDPARSKKKRRKDRNVLAQRQRVEEALGTSSERTTIQMPIRPAASQAEVPADPLYSSQPTLVTASQPLPGRHSGAAKAKKPRKRGF